MSRWLTFSDVTVPGTKTKVLEVRGIRGDLLGRVKWFGRWRQYAFFPEPDTTFNPECLNDIGTVILGLMLKRRIQP